MYTSAGTSRATMEPSGKTHGMRALIELRQEDPGTASFPAGTRLFEVPLAEALAISRTPVREAMSRLAEEGLLDRAQGGGFVVRTFAFADVVDAIELRGVLEGTAARLAAERGVAPAALVRIRNVVARARRLLRRAAGRGRLRGLFRAQRAVSQRAGRPRGQRGGAARDRAGPRGCRSHRPRPSRPSKVGIHRQPPLAEPGAGAAPRLSSPPSPPAKARGPRHSRGSRRGPRAGTSNTVMFEDRSLIGEVPGLALVVD